MEFFVYQADASHLDVLTELASSLWPHSTAEELRADLSSVLSGSGAAFFLAEQNGIPIGFAQCQLRHDYVEGTGTSPVGYLEGIYVAEGHRRQGAARALLSACESWAKAAGCQEFASDCELGNGESLLFHLGIGFEEANRIICFTKKL